MAVSPKLFAQMSELIAGRMTAGHYDVRLAENEAEVAAAQHLRYEVLFKESGGTVTQEMLNAEREEDEWDNIAFHVVVVDTAKNDEVVGTIRLVSKSALQTGQEFYTEHAFNIDALMQRYPKALELSRACVSATGRGGAILMLLWKFTMQFIEHNGYDILFGCASFKGQKYEDHAEILSYLYHKHLADADLMPTPKQQVNAIAIANFLMPESGLSSQAKVPTLLKGYLKIGARITDHIVIDPVFNTTFVVIYVVASEMFESGHSLVKHSI